MSGHVRTKSADFVIYRIWAGFAAFWSVLLHCRQHNWCLRIYRSHIKLPLGQGHARSRVPWAVFAAHFSRYNSISFINVTTLQLSWVLGWLFKATLMPYLESALTNWLPLLPLHVLSLPYPYTFDAVKSRTRASVKRGGWHHMAVKSSWGASVSSSYYLTRYSYAISLGCQEEPNYIK